MRLRRTAAEPTLLSTHPSPRPRLLRLAAAVIALAPAALAQNTIQVPAAQPTIQAGINAANPGDTVLVAPGTYSEHLNFNGKAITVQSSAGAATTIIDGTLTGAVVTLGTPAANAPSILIGFTVQNGTPSTSSASFITGGGIVILGNATVQANTVTDNESCGIEVATPNLIANILANHVVHNGFVQAPGGGSGCRIDGDGVDINLDMTNTTPGPATAVLLANNLIEQNAGAGVSGDVESFPLTVTQNIIRNNNGAGIALLSLYSPGVLANNLIYGNVGPGISAQYNFGAALSVTNNTLYANGGTSSTSTTSATELLLSGALVSAVNNIIVHTIVETTPILQCTADLSSPIPPVFDHNDIYATTGSVTNTGCLLAGQGNRSDNPLFTNPSTAATADFHLLSGSPEIDAGNNSAAGIPATDLSGSPRFQDATGQGYPIVDMGAYEASGKQQLAPTTVTLVPSTASPLVCNDVIITATVASPTGTPPGSVTLSSTPVTFPPTSQALVAGQSSFLVRLYTTGLHTFTATYAGTSPYTPATSVVLYVNVITAPACSGSTSTTTLSAVPNPANALQTINLTSTVTGGTGSSAVPTGSVTFLDGSTTLGTGTLDATGTAHLITNTLTTGSHTLFAAYPGNATYSASTSPPLSETVDINPTATTLTPASTFSPTAAFQTYNISVLVSSLSPVPLSCAPNCTITIATSGTLAASNTYTLFANGPVTFAETLPVGSYTFSATFNGTSAFGTSSSPTPVSETVVPAATTLGLTAAPTSPLVGQTVVLTAAFAAPLSSAVPNAAITFYDGGSPIGTGAIVAKTTTNSASATLSTSTLAPGVHTITAGYPGDANYLSSTSNSATVTVVTQDFTLALASPTITLRTQHHTTTSLTLTSLGSYADTLHLTCANLPTWVTCIFTPAAAPLTANAATMVSLYLDTDQVLGYARLAAPPTPPGHAAPIAGTALAFTLAPVTLLLLIGRRRRLSLRTSLALRLSLAALTLLPLTLALTGCTNIIIALAPVAIPASTAPGTYTIPITATGATLTHTTQLTLIVTP